ncbi:alpha/beta hydrolase [Alteribacillus sp. YIM 98480]|uniref:alpha/beta hydrolase n=1 Tax=Alteribacillus sp. YIM 98480 TaxID=2606599 RepID=UPI00131CF9B6|nr:alpha/beta hydrolase [Alteribacillus sp. YIM 98480]
MKKWILIVSGVMVVIFFAIILFGGHYLYSESVKRGAEVELYRGEETVSAPAAGESSFQDTDWLNNQNMQTLTITTFDNLTLKAGFIENKSNSGKVVLLAHGYRNQKESIQDIAALYHSMGYEILMPDARGHGESEGEYIGYGWHDRLDFQQWIEVLMEEHEAEEIFLHGESMGASLALMISGEDLPEEVKGIIADSGYTTVEEELTHQLMHLYGLPSFPLLDVASFITQFRHGYTFKEASAIEQVQKNTRPLLIIHGEDDELVPTEMASRIYEAAGGDKELWIVPDTGHIKAYHTEPQEFEKRLKDFITAALEE